MNRDGLSASLRRTWELAKRNKTPQPEGEVGLQVRDHRRMVGGRWDEIGKLQIDYLKQRGLRPDHVLLDVGCGSFRAGHHFIRFLDTGNYLGIDKQEVLVREGRKHEVGEALWAEKMPEIVLSDSFEFENFSKKPDYAIANSLFTHLSASDIKTCLSKLRAFAEPPLVFYATFFESAHRVFHVWPSHSSRRFEYTRRQMEKFGADTGWHPRYVGDWGHPRNQMMICYELR